MYVDGQPRKIKILFDDLNYPFTSKETFKIGAGGGLRFQGLIDDVRVYNIALSPEQAAVLPLLESVKEIAAIRPTSRTKAQQDKLNFCFLDRFASPKIQDARREMLAAQKKRLKYDESIQTVMVMQDSATPRDAFVLRRGAYDAHGEKVTAGVPAFLPPMREDWPKNRLGLSALAGRSVESAHCACDRKSFLADVVWAGAGARRLKTSARKANGPSIRRCSTGWPSSSWRAAGTLKAFSKPW